MAALNVDETLPTIKKAKVEEFTTRGSCRCDTVKFEVVGEPSTQGYCHCESCRNALSTAFVPYASFKLENFRVVEGQEHLGKYNKLGYTDRCFCKLCGCPTHAEVPSYDMVSIYTARLHDFTHQPTGHYYYSTKVMAVKDGLPKYSQYGDSALLEE
jgi:hypothetical protein